MLTRINPQFATIHKHCQMEKTNLFDNGFIPAHVSKVWVGF